MFFSALDITLSISELVKLDIFQFPVLSGDM